uniref:Uncharacterized protein n=1 Tax=Proboscia inermis TaxID=420281 RepID=A0A7S0C881_9STRA
MECRFQVGEQQISRRATFGCPSLHPFSRFMLRVRVEYARIVSCHTPHGRRVGLTLPLLSVLRIFRPVFHAILTILHILPCHVIVFLFRNGNGRSWSCGFRHLGFLWD